MVVCRACLNQNNTVISIYEKYNNYYLPDLIFNLMGLQVIYLIYMRFIPICCLIIFFFTQFVVIYSLMHVHKKVQICLLKI